jgi:hypothetical protein
MLGDCAISSFFMAEGGGQALLKSVSNASRQVINSDPKHRDGMSKQKE